MSEDSNYLKHRYRQGQEEFERVLTYAEDNAVSEWEMNFVASIRESYTQHGMQMKISPRQEKVLDDIAYKGK